MENDKKTMEEVTLLEAISMLYVHRKRKQTLKFRIAFDDNNREIYISKSFSKVREKWQYVIFEAGYPALVSFDVDFIGNLANTKGISFGGNVPMYKVYKCEMINI